MGRLRNIVSDVTKNDEELIEKYDIDVEIISEDGGKIQYRITSPNTRPLKREQGQVQFKIDLKRVIGEEQKYQ